MENNSELISIFHLIFLRFCFSFLLFLLESGRGWWLLGLRRHHATKRKPLWRLRLLEFFMFIFFFFREVLLSSWQHPQPEIKLPRVKNGRHFWAICTCKAYNVVKQQLFDEKFELFFNLKKICGSDPRQIGSKETGSLVENYFFEQNFFVSCFPIFLMVSSTGGVNWMEISR